MPYTDMNGDDQKEANPLLFLRDHLTVSSAKTRRPGNKPSVKFL